MRRFLLLREGDACTEIRRAESERILRAQPFLADATVTPYLDENGGVRLEVVTVDEFETVVGLGLKGGVSRPTRLKFGNANAAGQAIYAAAEWRDGFYYRDGFAARIVDYQFLGKPYQLAVEGERGQLGGSWEAAFSHPFHTDLQRIAWRGTMGGVRNYVAFQREGLEEPALSVARRFADVGGVIRIGPPGRLSLFGGSVSRENEEPSLDPVFITDSGIVGAPTPELVGRAYTGHRNARVNALWGVRNISFLRVSGFDALTARQDVRRGFQFGTLFGRSLSVLGSSDDDIFLAADVFSGYGTPRWYVGMQAQGEGREDGNTSRWDGVLTSGRVAWYYKPWERIVFVSSGEWGAGWRQRVPFQLSLSDPGGGVRGFRDSRLGGAHRAVVRVEPRWTIGRIQRLADVGLATFVDAGRLWAGDAPFGVDMPRPAVGVGLGLLAAVPPRSKRLWRLDAALPVTHDRYAKWEMRLSTSDLTRVFWREPGDIQRGRERTVPSSIFTWP